MIEYEYNSEPYWKVNCGPGKKRIYESPRELWDQAVKYFDWVEQNPLKAGELVKYQGDSKLAYVPKMRAMSVTALCIYIGISRAAWEAYKRRDEYIEVCEDIQAIIDSQKFEGAAAEMLNPMLIARDLELRDFHKSEVTGRDGGSIDVNVTDQELARKIAFILARGSVEEEKK